ncbi:DNA internalization-related competence protein ComEC/Rec2 [Crassaminicella indica]|uniref:DNA internalization-related competence protein ComEC/Rec2 n=1 Tax=Crassaminicella indica TaxID=2855394 RepID=A0ABX8RAX6_9CLOT|nr:DNA internalization-related competence protein ComEC/Rec2 [Crassaminicella indica]QXM06214.1 DNA internalization-related competence protein ComEC/Rec2 [Crassaminicella indica]
MRRPILMITAFYILGILLEYMFAMSYDAILYIFFIMIVAGICIHKQRSAIILFSIILLLGILNFKVNNEYDGELKQLFGKKVYVMGDVIDVVYKERMCMILKVEEIVVDGKKYRPSIKLLVKLKGENEELQAVTGKRIGMNGMLLEPQKRRNPKMFDYNIYLKSKNIYGILYENAKSVEVIGEGDIFFIIKIANCIKDKVVCIIDHIFSKREGGVFLGILLGDKEKLDTNLYKVFKKVGIAHILAVSGLHVGIIYMYINKLLKRFPLPIKIFSILAIVSFYVIITGCAPSVLRAASMTFILILAPLFDRRYDSLCAVASAGLIFLMINPLYLLDIGFQLSFTAVLGIILLYKSIFKKLRILPKAIRTILSVSMAAQIGVIPIVAYHFNYISLGAFIINIPIVMIVGFIVPVGLVSIIFGFVNISIASVFGYIVSILIKIMIALSTFIESMPFSSIEVISPSCFFIFFYYIFFLVWIVEDKKIQRYYISKKQGLILVVGLYVIINVVFYLMPNKMEITFVDVGQGDCILIRTPMKKNILIDGGGSYQKKIDVGEDILVPFLRKNHVGKIDLMILSHIHKDHIGGLICVLDHLRVKSLIMGTDYFQSEDLEKLKEKCRKQKTKIIQCLKNDSIKIEKDVSMKILHPDEEHILFSGDEINNNSLVVLMEYNGNNILFTGDLEAQGEEEILKSYPNLSVDLLKVAHHGSNSSTTNDFLCFVKPKFAVIQVGKNLHGHPHKDVLDRLKENDIVVFRNDEDGAVIVTLDEENIRIETMLHKWRK